MRKLLTALALGASALCGALPVDPPGSLGGTDPLALLVWLALLAPAAGCAAALLELPAWSYGAAVPGAWAIALVLVDAASARDLPAPMPAVVALAGLFFVGHAVGVLTARRSPTALATLLVASAALCAAPQLAGRLGTPWPPRMASVLLDLSPATFVVESAGVDWMRSAAIYAPAGTDRLERLSWSGTLAPVVALLVGCVAAALAAWITKRRGALRPTQSSTEPC